MDDDLPTLMMVSHGNRGEGGDPAGTLADALRGDWQGPIWHGYMRSEPALGDQLALLSQSGVGQRLIVFPLFFSEGYLVFDELPRNLQDAGLSDAVVLPPAINLPGFLDAVAGRVMHALMGHGWAASDSAVFLVPHGLKTLNAALPETVRFADALAGLCGGAEICIGNIEGQPSIADWRDISTRRNVVVVPLLAGGGTHARSDLPDMIGASPDDRVAILDPAGEWPELPMLVLAEARRHIAHFGGQAIPLGPTGGDIARGRAMRDGTAYQ